MLAVGRMVWKKGDTMQNLAALARSTVKNFANLSNAPKDYLVGGYFFMFLLNLFLINSHIYYFHA